jgi:peptidyl-dipeptidase Dcp
MTTPAVPFPAPDSDPTTDAAQSPGTAPVPAPLPADNPFAAPSALPYGLPDFAAIRTEHFLPALRAGIAEQRAIAERIAADDGPATFATVIEPLDRGSDLLQRVASTFFHLSGADGTPELLAIEEEIVPELTALEDAVFLNADLFARVDAVSQAGESLTPEQQQILHLTHQRFTLAGAQLEPAGREQLAALNQQIAQQETRFAQLVTKDMKAGAVHVADRSRLTGLDEAQLEAAAEAARDAGKDGFLLTLILPTEQPLLASLEDRGLREELYRSSVSRGTETWQVASDLAELRSRKAGLLGFADYAALAVADRTAAVPEAVDELFAQTVGPAMRNADREAERLTRAAAADGVTELAPWDWSYYAEQVRAQDYAVDQAALQPYFVLDRVLEDGVFYAAHELYGLSFTRRQDLVPPHPLARIWEVSDENGEGVGLFIGDYFTRDTKRGGAWMNTLRDQSHREGTKPVVMNTLNVSRPADGKPAFVSLDEVETMFHEFGHALHALLSDVIHSSVSGTSVPRDVVEFPSQVNEMWALRPGIVEHYARHVDTGEVVPDELLDKVRSARTWNEGFNTVEFLAAAVLDWRWHRLAPGTRVEDAHAFESEQLADAGLAHPLIAPRYRTGYFNHTFSGGYSAGYYSYLWAEVFDADSVAWFDEQLEAGTPLREAGRRFAAGVLSIGGSRPMVDAYRAFRGRDRDVRFLLERRGLL